MKNLTDNQQFPRHWPLARGIHTVHWQNGANPVINHIVNNDMTC